MFVSFFPKPTRLFFLSAAIWSLLGITLWYLFNEDLARLVGLSVPEDYVPPISPARFISPPFILFYLYYGFFLIVFTAFWMWYSPHRWSWWSIVGSAFILLAANFSVQVSIAINDWRGPFFNDIQTALGAANTISEGQLYNHILSFASIAFVSVTVAVLNNYLVSHWIFRWRTAMNDYFMSFWPQLRVIEGASQRVQEDTMRFAGSMEGLAVSFVSAVLTLFGFLPVLATLSAFVPEIPIVGAIPYSLVWAAIIWSVLGTVFIALIGIRLPGLEFRNQRNEAAYRKELVYGEDNPARAQPQTVAELFQYVRKNYFRQYFNYLYFNLGRIFYIQADNIFIYILLIPSIAAARLTFGTMQQITTAFGEVSNSFQYLFNVWPTIVNLLSVFKRLRSFEAAIAGKGLSGMEFDPEDLPPDTPLPAGSGQSQAPIHVAPVQADTKPFSNP